MNFKAVLVLPKTARFAHTQKSISFIWIVWSLGKPEFVYLWIMVYFLKVKYVENSSCKSLLDTILKTFIKKFGVSLLNSVKQFLFVCFRVSLYFVLFGLVGEPFLELLPDLSDTNANSRVKIFQDSNGKCTKYQINSAIFFYP